MPTLATPSAEASSERLDSDAAPNSDQPQTTRNHARHPRDKEVVARFAGASAQEANPRDETYHSWRPARGDSKRSRARGRISESLADFITHFHIGETPISSAEGAWEQRRRESRRPLHLILQLILDLAHGSGGGGGRWKKGGRFERGPRTQASLGLGQRSFARSGVGVESRCAGSTPHEPFLQFSR